MKTAGNLMKTFAAGWSAYKIGKFFTDGTKDAIDFGKEMQSLSRTMGGFDPGALLLVQKSLERAGMSAGEAQGHIGDFIREGRNLSEMFQGSENYAKALKSASQDYGSQAGVLHRSAAFLQTAWNTMESIGSKLRTFFLTMTEQFVGPLQVALDYLNQIDLAGVGASFGKAIGDAANTIFGIFKNGDTIEALKSGIVYAFYAGVDVLLTGFNKAIAFFSAAMESISGSFRESFFADDMITLMKDVFKGLGEIISSAILKAVGQMMIAMKISTGLKAVAEAAVSDSRAAKNHFNSVGNIVHDTDFLKAGFDSANAIKAGADAAGKVQLGQSESGKDAKIKWEGLQEILAKGFKTGTEMAAASHKDNSNASPKGILNTFSGSSSKVIADSLAKVGGGGGFLRAGMTLAERSAMQTAMATKQTAATLEAMHAESKTRPKATPTLGR